FFPSETQKNTCRFSGNAYYDRHETRECPIGDDERERDDHQSIASLRVLKRCSCIHRRLVMVDRPEEIYGRLPSAQFRLPGSGGTNLVARCVSEGKPAWCSTASIVHCAPR